MAAETVDERAALQQMDQVLELEAQIKRNHFRLLIGIKNTLNPHQQQKLHEIMKEMEQHQRGDHEMLQHGMMGGMDSREHMERMLQLEHIRHLQHSEQERRSSLPI